MISINSVEDKPPYKTLNLFFITNILNILNKGNSSLILIKQKIKKKSTLLFSFNALLQCFLVLLHCIHACATIQITVAFPGFQINTCWIMLFLFPITYQPCSINLYVKNPRLLNSTNKRAILCY